MPPLALDMDHHHRSGLDRGSLLLRLLSGLRHRRRIGRRHGRGNAQSGRLAVEFGTGEHAAVESQGNLRPILDEHVDLHPPVEQQVSLVDKGRLVGGAGQGIGRRRRNGGLLRIRIGAVPEFHVLAIRDQDPVGLCHAGSPRCVVGNHYGVVGHRHRGQRIDDFDHVRTGFRRFRPGPAGHAGDHDQCQGSSGGR